MIECAGMWHFYFMLYDHKYTTVKKKAGVIVIKNVQFIQFISFFSTFIVVTDSTILMSVQLIVI